MSLYRSAEREAFGEVPETCPAVDDAMHIATVRIKEQTGALRTALINALERALVAEAKISDLEDEVAQLRQQLELERNSV